MMMVQRRMNHLTLRRAVAQHCKRVKSGMILGGGVGQWKHGRPYWSHRALPDLFCMAVSMLSQGY